MNKPNYTTMSRKQLRTYILENREDEEAFQVYMRKIQGETNGEIYPAPQSIDDLNHFPELLKSYHESKEE